MVVTKCICTCKRISWKCTSRVCYGRLQVTLCDCGLSYMYNVMYIASIYLSNNSRAHVPTETECNTWEIPSTSCPIQSFAQLQNLFHSFRNKAGVIPAHRSLHGHTLQFPTHVHLRCGEEVQSILSAKQNHSWKHYKYTKVLLPSNPLHSDHISHNIKNESPLCQPKDLSSPCHVS